MMKLKPQVESTQLRKNTNIKVLYNPNLIRYSEIFIYIHISKDSIDVEGNQ